MIPRLGNALYWAFSGLAAVYLVIAVLLNWPLTQESFAFWVILAIPALLAWLVGRACHYVLGGDASALWEGAVLSSPVTLYIALLILLFSLPWREYGTDLHSYLLSYKWIIAPLFWIIATLFLGGIASLSLYGYIFGLRECISQKNWRDMGLIKLIWENFRFVLMLILFVVFFAEGVQTLAVLARLTSPHDSLNGWVLLGATAFCCALAMFVPRIWLLFYDAGLVSEPGPLGIGRVTTAQANETDGPPEVWDEVWNQRDDTN